MNKNIIGSNIKRYRKEKKITQSKLAELIGKSESTIQKYESGKVIPDSRILGEIAQVLDIPITHILGATETLANGGIVSFAVPDEIKKLYPPKKLTEEQFKIKIIKYLKKLHEENPMDAYIANIYDRYLKNDLTDKDVETIKDYIDDEKSTIQFWGSANAVFQIYGYENEAYELFKKMLIAMGYDSKEKIDRIGIFKMIKSQIEFAIYLSSHNK